MKNLKAFLILVLTIILGTVCFSSAGCKYGNISSRVGGKTYGFYYMKVVGGGITAEYYVGDTIPLIGPTTEQFAMITFNEDGTFNEISDGYLESGTWVQEGNKVSITYTYMSIDAPNRTVRFSVGENFITVTRTDIEPNLENQEVTTTIKYKITDTPFPNSSSSSSSSSIQQQVDVAGNTYGFKYMKTVMSGMTMEVNVNEPFMGVTFTETYFMFYFNEDGTGIYYLEGNEDEPATWETFTWTQEGSIVNVTYTNSDTEPGIFEIYGNEIWEEVTVIDPEIGEVYALRKLAVTTTAIPQQSSSSSSSSSKIIPSTSYAPHYSRV